MVYMYNHCHIRRSPLTYMTVIGLTPSETSEGFPVPDGIHTLSNILCRERANSPEPKLTSQRHLQLDAVGVVVPGLTSSRLTRSTTMGAELWKRPIARRGTVKVRGLPLR